MAKSKAGGGTVQNRAIYSRVSFLQQAATFLSASSAQQQPPSNSSAAATATAAASTPKSPGDNRPRLQGLARRLATDLRTVSLKTRIRLSPAAKQAVCKFCDSPLIEGQTCTSTVENRSRGGRKPWADVVVRKCHTCGRERRYPINAPRPKRKSERRSEGDVVTVDHPQDDLPKTVQKQAG